ncbi:hypothetical protein FOL47_000782 [Perkinsus chesapeaki]|uniref:C3H1-type domain-containing protein n=1 Tax=Perkinsus chesapeaki TaxID=330153 RepID=A0A7J6KWR7_PERCH|nr:hypothetical protein FOL47_000782 [Perkinsus chesapeaki]
MSSVSGDNLSAIAQSQGDDASVAVPPVEGEDSMSEGTSVDPGEDIPQPADIPVNGPNVVVGDGGQGDRPATALPDEAIEFLNNTVGGVAAEDIVRVLRKRRITSPAMFELLDAEGCALLSEDLEDKINTLGLRALGRFYADKKAKRRRLATVPKEKEFDALLRRLQDTCAAKYGGFRVPGRFLLPPALFSRLQKGDEVDLDQMVTGSAASGDTNHKLTFDTALKTFSIDEVGGKSRPPLCHSAGLVLAMVKWGLSASLLGQLEPIHVLCYMARVAEACLNCSSGISVMKAIDLDLRTEARRGASTSSLGVQLTQEFGDIVLRHSAAGQVAACFSSQSKFAEKGSGRMANRGNPKEQICRYYPLGRCFAGDKCKFKHLPSDAPQGRNGNSMKDTGKPKSVTGASPIARSRETRETMEPTLQDIVDTAQSRVPPMLEAARCLSSRHRQANGLLQTELFNDNTYKDGGFSALPTAPAHNESSDEVLRTGTAVAVTILEEAETHGLLRSFREVNGSPTAEQASALRGIADRVGESCRTRIADLLKVNLSPPSNGNHIYCDLLHALAVAFNDPDVDFPLLCSQGLPLGITEGIPPCPLYPTYHPKAQESYPVPREHHNYRSMKDPAARQSVAMTLEEEEQRGFIRKLSPAEAADPGRTFTPRAAIPKGDSPDDGFRVIDDFLRSNTNMRASVPNTNTLPGGTDLRRMVGSLCDEFPDVEFLPFKLDFQAAYRHLGIRPSERRHVCFMHEAPDGSKEFFENLALPFGLNSSGYWFVRFASLGQRCIVTVLTAILKSRGLPVARGGLQYVDDGFWLLLKCFYYEAAVIVTMMWHLLGATVSFPKLRVGVEMVDCIGITVDLSDSMPAFSIREAKVQKLADMLSSLLATEKIHIKTLRSLTGKLTHYTQLRLFLRSYTQPFYALESIMAKKNLFVATCPRSSEIGAIARFFLELVSDPRSLAPVGPLSYRVRLKAITATVMVDASTRAVAGVLALGTCDTSIDSLGPWVCLLKDRAIPQESRNVSAFKLIAACLGLKVLENIVGSASSCNVVIYTDSEGRNLHHEVNDFVRSAVAESTRKGYTAAENLYIKIIYGRDNMEESIYPLSGNLLLLYIYVMSKVGYASSTIRTYVCGLKSRNLENGFRLSKIETERIRRAVKAAEKQGGTSSSGGIGVVTPKLVLRPAHLRAARNPGASRDPCWVAMLLCVFALLRARECLALRLGDLRFSVRGGMDVVKIAIRKSKCDQVGKGALLTVGCAKGSKRRPCGERLCPVHNLYRYLTLGCAEGRWQRCKEALVFVAPEHMGEPLTYNGFLLGVRRLLGGVTGHGTGVTTHALRRSEANWLWQVGVPLFNIREFGRWSTRGTLEDRYLSGATQSQQFLYCAAALEGQYKGI